MTVTAARSLVLKAGGTPTTMTGEACGDLGAGSVFRVTSATKRVIDPATAVVVYENASPVSEAATLDYVHGLISFEDAGHATITMDGKYVPLLTVAEVDGARIQRPQPIFADVTHCGDTAPRLYEVAKRCEISFDHSKAALEELATGITLESLLSSGDPIFVEAQLSAAEFLRGWFMPSEETRNMAIDDALRGTIVLRGVVRTCVGRPTTEQALFSIYTS